MMNNLHQVKWAKEFGNGLAGSKDYCSSTAISRDGFIVYVIGHTYDFITYTPPSLAPVIPNTDFYILQVKINDGTLMKQKFILGNDFDYFRAMKFNRNSLFIVGDTFSVFPWAFGQT
jgi:hypothetical protein